MMNWNRLVPVIVTLCAAVATGAVLHEAGDENAAPVPNVVTTDIQAGIEKHVDAQIQLGNGYFSLPFKDKDLRLKLVRVHMEYLANLGPRRHFACVDLADVSGDVYDVDFFLSGDPGDMTVTETTVHKINGQPYYAWDQAEDGTWHHVPVEQASEGHFGVIRGRDSFEFRYWAELPELTGPSRMWLPLPETDSFQTVEVKSIEAPGLQRVLRDHEPGNRVLLLELEPQHSGKTVEIVFDVERSEKAAYEGELSDASQHLSPEQLVPATDTFGDIAREVIEGKKTDLVRARAPV